MRPVSVTAAVLAVLVTEPAPAILAASSTGMIVSTMTTVTTALTSGSCWPSLSWPKIQIGSVFCAPEVNTVTTTSSNESANASRAPEISAVITDGRVTHSCVCQPRAPRSIEASAREPGVRRSLAIRLLKTITMQNVACPMTIVHSDNCTLANVKAEFSARPVTIPGASRPTLIDSKNADRTAWSCQATENQCIVKPRIGQLSTVAGSNA